MCVCCFWIADRYAGRAGDDRDLKGVGTPLNVCVRAGKMEGA